MSCRLTVGAESLDKKSAYESSMTPLERCLYFTTAHAHLQAGCPMLALEVLSKLPDNVLHTAHDNANGWLNICFLLMCCIRHTIMLLVSQAFAPDNVLHTAHDDAYGWSNICFNLYYWPYKSDQILFVDRTRVTKSCLLAQACDGIKFRLYL